MINTAKYLLRWRYDYPEKVVRGMWSNAGENPANQAWSNNKEGLVRAIIEGKDLKTKEIKVLAECPGEDFRVFQWVASVRMPGGAPAGGSVTIAGSIIGMKLLTRDEELTILDTGLGKARPLPESEKNLNFRTYGK